MKNEKQLIENFAKILGTDAVSKLKQLDEQREKEARILRSLGAQFNVKVDNIIGEENIIEEAVKELISEEVVEQPKEITEEAPVQVQTESAVQPMPELPAETIVTAAVKKLSEVPPPDIQKAVDKISDSLRKEIEAIKKAVADVHSFARRTSQMGGGGEVNFRYLDDVNRATMNPGNDNWVLEYDAATKKAQFTKDIGPIDSVAFDINHVDDNHPQGTLCWNKDDATLNLSHGGGVTQQIGQEQYYLVKNNTGSNISNGTVCMFAGAESDNNSRLLATPFIADGTYPSLYSMGVAAQDIANGAEGFVTVFGRVGDMNTAAWSLGDILYADPSTPGGLTNVKPTSPNNVSVIAAVVKVDATEGQIFVRPTIEQKMLYGRFSDTTDQIPALPNTPYAITFDTVEVERGFHNNGGTLPTSTITAEESGYYQINVDMSLTSTNSSAKTFYVWLRKNGVDVPYSARRQSVAGNGTYLNLMYNTTFSLNKNDIFEIMYAVNDTTISINSPPATAFSPAIPSVTLIVTQIAL